MKKIFSRSNIGPTHLVVFQATPFCNIDCRYCYLPNRDKKDIISLQTIKKTFDFLINSNLLTDKLSILWHMGEPLAAGISFYENAFSLISNILPKSINYHHSFQTNAILINDKWCELIKKNNVRVGVSIDGPKFIHDKNRFCKNGKGSFELVMKALGCLQKHEIEYSTISVLGYESLIHYNEIFNFFENIPSINYGFNIEEVDGIHHNSSLLKNNSKEKLQTFYNELYSRCERNNSLDKIRELKKAKRKIYSCSGKNQLSISPKRSSDNYPFRMFNVMHDGMFSTYSPELINFEINDYGKFTFGNVHTSTIDEVLNNPKFIILSNLIENGINNCKKDCDYFDLCGGGAPTNKYFENNSFESTETMFCNLNIKTPIDIVLGNLEKKYS